MKRVIITNTLGYLQLRNFASLNFKKYELKKKHDIYKILAWGAKNFLNIRAKQWINLYNDFDFYDGDICHFFNTLSKGKRPWITSFSTCVPRFGKVSHKVLRKGVELLARNQCKKIIAISENAKGLEENFILKNFPDYQDDILNKLTVL